MCLVFVHSHKRMPTRKPLLLGNVVRMSNNSQSRCTDEEDENHAERFTANAVCKSVEERICTPELTAMMKRTQSDRSLTAIT